MLDFFQIHELSLFAAFFQKKTLLNQTLKRQNNSQVSVL